MDPLKDMREYIQWLEKNNILIKVNDELSPILEIPAFLRKVMYSKGPAVLFEKIKGFENWKIAGNLFPNLDLIKSTLSVNNLEEIGNRMIEPITSPIPFGLLDKVKALGEVSKLSSYFPKKTSKAAFTENIIDGKDNPLEKIPFFKTWPNDGGRYATYPMVITMDQDKKIINMGVYRMMIIDGNKAVIHWQIHKRGALMHMKAIESSKEEIPIAVAIGSDPGTMLASVSPVPYPIDKSLFAGIIRGKGIELYELDNGIMVPSNAEIILEGRVLTNKLVEEGPFGDHWGYYDKPIEKYPLFIVDKAYIRNDPIYFGSVVGLPPLEDAVLGKAIERMFKPIMQVLLPEIIEINYPVEGVFQGMLIVSIKKRYPGQAKKVMSALWGIGQSSLTKIIIVVDNDVDPHDLGKVIWSISCNVNPERDVLILSNSHSDALDPSNLYPSFGSKLGIDATRKMPEENWGKPWPKIVEEDEEILRKIEPLVNNYLKKVQNNPNYY
ncbi:UbiD family decarboxylase [Caldisphaera lagunensis DSM 15908]|uniref:UbiD family decarboxylase n=1 Tax=Caldisphaera lagunensis (strain DSM 15908 / JCM 11604 / ANMR 0165 / IC-154) TaxID=1056495 RepID=L0A944_CALLD|nr:UbiD family decarboxylase [Caldisphaera lagunensis]AFZ69944.1 UbiD family decarboxylase [Caldisphaera lagunensis DSM 15908]